MGLSTRLYWLYGIIIIAHRGHGEYCKRKGENGKRKTGLDDSIAHHLWRQVFATLLLESNPSHSILFKVCLILLIRFSARGHGEYCKRKGSVWKFHVSGFMFHVTDPFPFGTSPNIGEELKVSSFWFHEIVLSTWFYGLNGKVWVVSGWDVTNVWR